MALLTTSQLTFYDMKDAYHVEINPDYIVVKCDENGNSKEATNIEIKYGIYCGSTRVPGTATVDFNIEGKQVQYEGANCTTKADGTITFAEITKGTNFIDIDSIHITFKEHNAESNGDDFTFEKYIKFVKVADGVNGSDGTGLVFKVYSEDGTVFREDMSEINLETVAILGDKPLDVGCFTWQWCNTDNTNTDKWEDIKDENGQPITTYNLLVLKNSDYALKSIRCGIKYNGVDYYDYISLTDKVDVYSSVVKYATTNVFDYNTKYLLAYMALYKNGKETDLLKTDLFSSAVTVSIDGTIDSSNVEQEYCKPEQLIYFVVPDDDNATTYHIVLGQYDGDNWKTVNFSHDYFYTNSKSYDNFARIPSSSYESKIMVVSKTEVNKNLDISFSAFDSQDASNLLAICNGTITDSSDPIISNGPEDRVNRMYNPKNGQLWIDTSKDPHVVKVCTVDETNKITWVETNEYSGNKIYTSEPHGYLMGDIWVVGDKDKPCEYTDSNGVTYKYGPGSMLRASQSSTSYDPSHWSEITSDLTNMRDDIKQSKILQSYSWDEDNGVTISDNNKFYVNIKATEMGFCERTGKDSKQIVSIGNQSATINNLNTQISATFNCNADFNSQINIYNPYRSVRSGFVWNIETDGSLSLINVDNVQQIIRGTWEDVFDSEINGTYKQKYKIGDTIPLDLGSEGIIDMQIVAFDADILADGTGKSKITWISKQVLCTHRMNEQLQSFDNGEYVLGTGACGGWSASEMRKYLQDTILQAVPKNIRNNIKNVFKYNTSYSLDGQYSMVRQEDSLWIPSYREVGGNDTLIMETDGPIYEWFGSDEKRIKYDLNGNSSAWWLRSASSSTIGGFKYIPNKGFLSNAGYATSVYGVVIGFCT